MNADQLLAKYPDADEMLARLMKMILKGGTK